MKKQIISMAMLLYALSGYGQLPTPTINVADHVMYSSAWDQFMPCIAVDKLNAPNVLVSFATASYTLHHQSNYQGWYYFSPTGSITPAGNTGALPYGQSHGSPSVAFDANSRAYLMGLEANQTGFFNVTSDNNNCATWNSPVVNTGVTSGANCWTPMGTVDDDPTSPYVNNVYMTWEDATDSPEVIKIETSTDGGLTFSNETTLSQYVSAGPNVQTGPDGEVYVCWADYGDSPDQQQFNTTPPVFIGFATSTDGGVTYTKTDELVDYVGLTDNGVASTNPNFNNTYVNSYPSMAVDKSCGPNRGNIYIVASFGAGAINMWYYNHSNNTWTGSSSPIIVSKSTLDHCWFPWVAVDDLTGVVSVVYYGSDGSVVSNTNTYVAYSDPTDPTSWANIQVSSAAQTPANFSPAHNNNYPLYYDYANGIASYGGHAYPVWQDGRSGTWQIWTADIAYDAPQLASSSTIFDICNTSITFPKIITGNITYQATDQIKVATCSSGGEVSVASTASATMIAGQNIIIGPGFSTQPGAVFTAEIKTDITSCQTPGVQSFKTNWTNTVSDYNSVNSVNASGVNIFAYPNPTNDLITVGISNNNYQNVSFLVSDVSGRMIAQYNSPVISDTNVLQKIDLHSYSDGLYLITIIADKQKFQIKFVKE